MAYSFRAGTNWCHDFPKLARDSGFYFNSHRTRARVDWNRISTIDIDRVIQERDFLIVDENINNVVDYHLETEYDVKILDNNFVKIFRLAQLSVEYLLYCKQYLDRSVIILKDELRSKLEENDKLKKEVTSIKENNKDLKDKFRDKYKFIEKTFSDSHGEIHKCPFCQKTFISAVFMNSHIARRHSNSSQLSVSSPVHEQYKAEAEKLHNEIKNLKERLNQTERLIRSDSIKLTDSVDSSKERYSDLKNDQFTRGNNDHDKIFVDEHKRYREEISNLTSMLFSEIRNLKQDDKKNVKQIDGINENWKILLKQQESEIQRLRDQYDELCTKKSTVDIDSIQLKLNSQEQHWQSKIELLESQHRIDIEKLYNHLKITQESANRMRDDYVSKINELKQSKTVVLPSTHNLQKNEEYPINKTHKRQKQTGQREYSKDRKNEYDGQLIIQDISHQTDIKRADITRQITVNTFDHGDDTIIIPSDKPIETIEIVKTEPNSITNGSAPFKDNHNRWNVDTESDSVEQNEDHKTANEKNKKDVQVQIEHKKMEITSSESDETDSMSESISESETTTTEEESDSADESDTSQQDIQAQDNKQLYVRKEIKTKDELTRHVHKTIDQKLKDLGIDPEWRQIPSATYRQSIDTVKYHRSISCKKFSNFEVTRRKILEQLAQKLSIHQKSKKSSTNDNSKKSPLNKLMGAVKTKAFKALSIQPLQGIHTPTMKLKTNTSHDKSVTNKLNIQLLPQKISRLEFQEIKTISQQKLRRSRDNAEKKSALSSSSSSSIHNRYTMSPRLNNKSIESIDTKLLSHSYESIKDYTRDSNASRHMNFSGPIITSTPQKSQINILPNDKAATINLSSHTPKPKEILSLPNSPKNNKSVLKSTTGSTGSLVKKKVLFDLQSSEEHDQITEQLKIDEGLSKPIKDKESESDFEISSISNENSVEIEKNIQTKTDNIILKTAQSEKIAEISRKIETQLSLSRQKPVGGIEAMFVEDFNPDDYKECPTNEVAVGSIRGINSQISTNKLPQPTPRTPRINHHFPTLDKSVNSHYDSNDINLDKDIEELLRMD